MPLLHSILATMNRIENSVYQFALTYCSLCVTKLYAIGFHEPRNICGGSSAAKRLKNTAVEKEAPLNVCSLCKSITLGTLFQI